MVLKILLIGVAVILGLLVVLPFVLSVAGFNYFNLPDFSSDGGGSSSSSSVGRGLLRSRDGGENWEDVSFLGDRRVSLPAQILDIAFHPQNPDLIFMGTRSSGIWKSIDTGQSWEKIYDKSRVLDPSADVYKIAVSRSNPQILYAALFQDRRGRVLRSSDGGNSFREIYFVTADNFGVFDLYINPVDEDWVMIVTGQGGVLETKNGGRTWRVIKWFGNSLVKILVNPVFPMEMFVINDQGSIFKTFDRGENWADLSEESGDLGGDNLSYRPQVGLDPFAGLFSRSNKVVALVSDPRVFTTLYLGTKEGVLRSLDGGFVWKRLNLLIPPEALPINAVAVHPRSSDIIFAGASSQLHRSDDGGLNWRVAFLPVGGKVKNLFIHPLKPEIMFAVLER